MLPESVNAFTPWLPTSMALELIGHFFISDKFHPDLLFAGFGLLAYAIVFLLASRVKNSVR
jgi:hypothetical protein